MLSEFEARFAEVLGSRLPTPFAGRVRRRGQPPPSGNGPLVVVGVDSVDPLEPDFGSVRPEVVPGSDDQRRIVRLGVTVRIAVEPASDEGRLQALAGIDAVVYEMQHPEMRTAAALVTAGDLGFAVEHMRLAASDLGTDNELLVHAEGWFWPVGVAGETGRPIERSLVREFRLPMRLGAGAAIEAGGADVALDLAFGSSGTMNVVDGPAASSSFGSVALRLLDAGGGPGAGTLVGGVAGPDGTHIVPVAEGAAIVTYRPPGAVGTDHLVVSTHARDGDGNERLGFELARFDLVVQP